ncbi:ninjurin-1-like [Portunus trituberculatus]|uniref:ninjurin-1-like n=1 Tax=Portunus trituberculatus TaxID=210409 RepID=UPI001E1CB176|nr:ninjurin-1-like [Portunus trituberculatus]
MKRNMTIAKGFLDISLLSANANQLRNVIYYGDRESTVFYLILSGIILSLILQVSAGVVLILAERFDINKEEDQEHGDWMNTLVTCIIFIVLIINVFVASLGVDVADPFQPPSYPGLASSTTLSPLDVFKGPNYG